MSDRSPLDTKYFIDSHVYNCLFCNRRNVKYNVGGYLSFDWSTEKKCNVYLSDCRLVSKSRHRSGGSCPALGFERLLLKDCIDLRLE